MKYQDLVNSIKDPWFSLQDLKLLGATVFPYQITDWTKKGYIVPLKRGLYLFSERAEKVSIFNASFLLYQPSYISLERALSFYGLIPEMVYAVTAITPKTTRTFENSLGLFLYRHIKKELFFGYQKIENDQDVYLMAEPEKALLDYLYLNSARLKSKEDVGEMRFNQALIKALDKKKLSQYQKLFASSRLEEILKLIY